MPQTTEFSLKKILNILRKTKKDYYYAYDKDIGFVFYTPLDKDNYIAAFENIPVDNINMQGLLDKDAIEKFYQSIDSKTKINIEEGLHKLYFQDFNTNKTILEVDKTKIDKDITINFNSLAKTKRSIAESLDALRYLNNSRDTKFSLSQNIYIEVAKDLFYFYAFDPYQYLLWYLNYMPNNSLGEVTYIIDEDKINFLTKAFTKNKSSEMEIMILDDKEHIAFCSDGVYFNYKIERIDTKLRDLISPIEFLDFKETNKDLDFKATLMTNLVKDYLSDIKGIANNLETDFIDIYRQNNEEVAFKFKDDDNTYKRFKVKDLEGDYFNVLGKYLKDFLSKAPAKDFTIKVKEPLVMLNSANRLFNISKTKDVENNEDNQEQN